MKRILSAIVAVCILLSFSGCSRNYTGWKSIRCNVTDSDTEFSAEAGQAKFRVPAHWILSRVGDFWFFADYKISSLDEIVKERGDLYIVGWINKTETGVTHSIPELFPEISIPDDAAMFSVGIRNGAVYGQEKYIYNDEIWTKYYVSLKTYDIYELKLIDWHDKCGKELMKNIARSFEVGDSLDQDAASGK